MSGLLRTKRLKLSIENRKVYILRKMDEM